MASNVFSELPAMFMAYHVYGPFTHGANIFAGGCQGPLYPNPTTLIMPSEGFLPLNYQQLSPTDYTMKANGDFYEGIGVGNPGIKYGNPGHVLGVFDTYCRMSYGLNIIKAARLASTEFAPGAAIDTYIPLRTIGGDIVFLRPSDIYPTFASSPDAYLSASVVEGSLILDPRTNMTQPFVFDGTKYSHSVSQIDFPSIFGGIGLDSYYYIIPQLRNMFTEMAEFASQFAVENEEQLNPIPFGTSVPETPRLFDYVTGFSSMEGRTVELSLGQPTYWKHIGTPLDADSALTAFTGSPELHDSGPSFYEYRSLTELNGVVNVLPIQTYGMRFAFLTDNPDFDSGPFNQIRYYMNFSITEINLNIIAYDAGQEITINGSVDVTFSGVKHRDPVYFIDIGTGELILVSPEFDSEIGRQFLFSLSHNNSFTWDRAWLGLGDVDNVSNDYEEHHEVGNEIETTRTFAFSRTVQLQPGNNIISAKLMTQTVNIISVSDLNPDDLSLSVNMNIPELETLVHNYSMAGGIV